MSVTTTSQDGTSTRARPRITTRSILVLLLICGASALAGYGAYQRFSTVEAPPPKGQVVSVQRGSIAATVNTTGSVVAGTTAKVGFRTSGRLSQLLVQVGDSVKEGQPLARVEHGDLELQVTQSKAQLAAAEAKLAQLQQGSRPEEIVAAESSLASAKAKLALLKAGPTEADLQSAQGSVASAKSSLASAQAKLADLRSQPKPEDVRAAELQLEKAKNSLWATQIDRDGICGRYEADPNRNSENTCSAANARIAAGETDVTNAVENLKKVSQPAKATDIKAAEEALASAQVALEGASAKLLQVKSGATDADIAAAQAAVDSAASQLNLKRVPYTEADLQSARAGVDQSKAALAISELSLKNATLLAPFAGKIAAVGFNLGEIVGSGNTITVVDPKAIRVDVTVDESDVAKLEAGQVAEITFDSLSGRAFAGKITALSPSGTVQSGVVTYLVSLSIGNADLLKPGMTANANIVHSKRDNVLMVPNRAIKAQGRNRVVDVVDAEGNTQTRGVTVGLSNDQFTEILDGLQQGEAVMIASTSTVTPRLGGAMPGGGMPAGGMPGAAGGRPVIIQQR